MNGRIGLPRRTAAWRALAAVCLLGSVLAAPAQEERRDTTAARGVRITAEQERATARALAWLARAQNDDGSWDGDVGFKLNNSYRTTREGTGHAGVTALCGMAFLAGGHLPGRGPYGEVVDRAVDFLLSCSNEDGFLSRGGTRMYSHAFATLFLAEVYGMTHREDTRVRLQKAVDFIVKSQNAEGGWRYGPQAQDSDMSIVVCQCLALRAARNIGIRVPKSTIDSAVLYVVDSAVKSQDVRRYNSPGTFTYQRDANSRTTFPLTAAGVTALNGLGIYSDELIDRGIEYLNDTFERFNYSYGRSGHYFFWYGHYYGVQAMYTKGGHDWVNYFERLRSLLLSNQRADGSWPNQIGPGAAFSTAMGCLILEIPYDFLPIFHR
ncbi:MAG: prenyltransferase/squalene oxidase repeat-containing protein [Planctomycetota bacterium]|nr:prenyltransferase/squalene oxidase repeat-containing protein [Planctomycetota bacterium]MEC8511308.1 prenyltransferase/squalene oxidase repeat-containing protein [Planctomycetota bacterium]MEE2941667.1 prenyltransferase/squalene oxidase repeat-containing protein [Planctomycetota bacterium]